SLPLLTREEFGFSTACQWSCDRRNDWPGYTFLLGYTMSLHLAQRSHVACRIRFAFSSSGATVSRDLGATSGSYDSDPIPDYRRGSRDRRDQRWSPSSPDTVCIVESGHHA